ncbi:VCBS repeat-containing protein [Archangium gephyra]|nr:VCBS repeat-containing protein [Archangium gephyra]
MPHPPYLVSPLSRRLSVPLALTLTSLLTGTGCGGPESDASPPGTTDNHPPLNPLAPAAPMHEFIPEPVLCDAERCAGTEPIRTVRSSALYRTGKHGRGTNTQLPIPQNLQLADIDADGFSDFVQFSSNKLFASKTDFNKTGILHLYANRPIKRVLLGDFSGSGSDQTCVIIDDNALACYGVSTDRSELWWWFTQGTILGDNEDAIVADFDNDGRDDVLVYPRGGGAYRMYSVKGSYFFNPTPSFSPGNLGTATSGLQLRAGDFNGDGRDDLMVINGSRQVLYYTSVWDGTSHTFWWAFTSVGGFVGVDDQVTVARIDNNATDDIVLRNKVTGATRFHRMEYNSGSPPAITSPGLGQISTAGNSQIFWGYMHGSLSETGAYWRDDAMVYEQGWNGFVRADARWDGSQLTYWWAYTQSAPNNHTGWASFAAKPWLLLKCKFSDITNTPQSDQFYRDLMHGALVPYWRDVSYGSWDLSGSTVKDSWYTMSITNSAWSQPSVSRWDRVGHCMNAYGGSTRRGSDERRKRGDAERWLSLRSAEWPGPGRGRRSTRHSFRNHSAGMPSAARIRSGKRSPLISLTTGRRGNTSGGCANSSMPSPPRLTVTINSSRSGEAITAYIVAWGIRSDTVMSANPMSPVPLETRSPRGVSSSR